ncbi:hypothetical protein L210DRAFT_799294, partial [Boletus edulis BED1]
RPPNIVWDEGRVQELVTWLITHPADRHVLYHDRNQAGSAPPLPPNERPSGRQKKDVHAAIAKNIFNSKDPEYSNDPERYTTSVSNRLTALKRDYQKCRNRLKQTGAGVHPDDPNPNLLSQIRSDFPHYDELDEIWRGIPGFDSDLISSDPTVDHAQGLLSLV